MTNEAEVRVYAELNDFLPRDRRFRSVAYRFGVSPSVKDVIEAMGVPHTEVDLVLVNGESVGFEHRVADGDRIAVYPMFELFDISPVAKVRPDPLRDTRFVLDVHLGRLARLLRLLGFDAEWSSAAEDEALAARSVEERRILLTRDRGLLKRSAVTHGYCVRSDDPEEQVREVVDRFDLTRNATPFSRCTACNGHLEVVSKAEVDHLLQPATRREHDEFRQCSDCGRVYWKGSHYERLARLVEELRGSAPR